MKRDCPSTKSGARGPPERDDKDKKGGPLAVIPETSLSDVTSDEWIVHTGATEHISYNHSSFTNYRALSHPIPIRVGNNETIHGIGIGDIRVLSRKLDDSTRELVLVNDLHVPDLARELILLAAATYRGYSGYYNDDLLVLEDENRGELIVAKRDGRLYKPDIAELDEEALLASSQKDDIWNERMGHINKRRIVQTTRRLGRGPRQDQQRQGEVIKVRSLL